MCWGRWVRDGVSRAMRDIWNIFWSSSGFHGFYLWHANTDNDLNTTHFTTNASLVAPYLSNIFHYIAAEKIKILTVLHQGSLVSFQISFFFNFPSQKSRLNFYSFERLPWIFFLLLKWYVQQENTLKNIYLHLVIRKLFCGFLSFCVLILIYLLLWSVQLVFL